MTDIQSQRLVLRLVPLAALASTAANNLATSERLIGSSLTEEWLENSWVAQQRLDQWKNDATYAPWSIRCIVHKKTEAIVGNINAHDSPRAIERNGATGLMVEIGYTIFKPWRRQGMAFEAVTAMISFARSRNVRWIRLSISPENLASLKLAQKLGARNIGTQIDDRDGPEDIFLLDI